MRKLLSLLFICIAIFANARQITSDEAAAIATDFLNSSASVQKAGTHVNVRRAQSKKDAYRSIEENQPYYVFNGDMDGGFVIISGDDRTRKILGYSDKGSFDFDNMPPQLAAMLDLYAKQIETLPASATVDPSWSKASRAASDGDGVLLETANWGQGYPYNAQCPVIDGVQCPTGCVATAMAIVMKYHNWPYQGNGTIMAIPAFENRTEDLLINFNDYQFNWANMLSNYSSEGNYPDINIEEVAKLNYACGRGANMIYYPGGSGAMSTVVGYTMARFFGYNTKYKHVNSQDYSIDEWQELIKNEIESERPLIFCISENGHSLVCDGYKGNLLHFNWGWDGSDNGYFDSSLWWELHCSTDIELYPVTDNIEIGDLFLDDGSTVPLSNTYNGGIKTNTENIAQGLPFELFIETLNADACCFYGSRTEIPFGVAHVDKNGNVKDVVFEECINAMWGNDKENFRCYVTGWNGHIGIKLWMKIVSLKSSIEEGDGLQLLTKDSLGNWIDIKGINNTSVVRIDELYKDVSVVNLESNIDGLVESHDFLKHPLFKGLSYQITIPITYDETGIPKMQYITINGKVAQKGMKYNPFTCAVFCPKEDNYIIIANEEESSDLLDVEITDCIPGEIKTRILNEYPNIGLINKLKVIGSLDAEDLKWIYNSLPSLESLDLSESTAVGELEFSNVDENASFLAVGQVGYLKILKLPNNITKIPINTFSYFEPLQQIYFPSSLEKVENAFVGANSLRCLVFDNPEPCELDEDVFNDSFYYDKITLYVPSGAKTAYSNHPNWGKFKRIVETQVDYVDFWTGFLHYVGSAEDGISVKEMPYYYKDLPATIKVLDNYTTDLGEIIPVKKLLRQSIFTRDEIDKLILGDNIEIIEKGAICTPVNYVDLSGTRSIEDFAFTFPPIKSIHFGSNIEHFGNQIFNFDARPNIIYWECDKLDNYNLSDFINGQETTIICPYLSPTFELSGEGTVLIPGQSTTSYCNIKNAVLNEMWSYGVDRKSGVIKIEPLIDGLVIDKVTVNGKELAKGEGFLYYYGDDNNEKIYAVSNHLPLDVVVEYTLHERQQMTTHYDAEFNAAIPSTELALVSEIVLSSEDVTLFVGETAQLTATVLPENAVNKTLEWTSSDENVASVDTEGTVTAVGLGEAIIIATATDGSGVSATCTVTVKAPERGDSNANGTINIADAVNTANYAVGNEVEHFCVEAADVNADGVVTVADASGTITIILAQSVAENQMRTRLITRSISDDADYLIVDDYSASVGETINIGVGLDNSTDYVALQADIILPEGVTLQLVTGGERAVGYSLMSRKIDDNRVRVALFNLSNSPFAHNNEALINVNVKVEDTNAGDIMVENIIASDALAHEYILTSTGGHNTGMTGIDKVSPPNISVRVENTTIKIYDAVGETVAIYGVDGRLLTRFAAKAEIESYRTVPGVYIITVGDRVIKTVVK